MRIDSGSVLDRGDMMRPHLIRVYELCDNESRAKVKCESQAEDHIAGVFYKALHWICYGN